MIDYNARRKKVQAILAEKGVNLLAVGPSENMSYMLGFHTHADERPCLLMLSPKSSGFLMPALNAEDAKQKTQLSMVTWADDRGPKKALEKLAKKLNFAEVKKVALDETMRTDFSLLLLEHLPEGAKAGVASDILGDLRMRKDDEEIELIQENANLADNAMQAAFAAIEPNVTETDVANAAREAFKDGGVDQVNFTIVGSGPNGAYPHHHTGKRKLKKGDAIVIDIGARKDLYNSDITRMAFLGEPSKQYLEVHGVVEDAVKAALATIKPGIKAMEVDKAARSVISKAGYGKYFVHRTGHGLGLTGHELPNISASSEVILEEGMVFSVEPGIYLPGEFGVRLEDIIVVTAQGPRIFSKLPRDLHVV